MHLGAGLESAVTPPAGSAPAEIEFGAFCLMTSCGNNFNYFPENQLTKFKLCPPTSLFLSPSRISVTHFASPGVPLDASGASLLTKFLETLSQNSRRRRWKTSFKGALPMLMIELIDWDREAGSLIHGGLTCRTATARATPPSVKRFG